MASLHSPAAQAQGGAVKAIFEKYDLLTVFAIDCSKPASRQNPYYYHRLVDADHVQRDAMASATDRVFWAVIETASETKPNEIAVSGSREGKPLSSVYRVEPTRVRVLESTVDGKVEIAGGRLVNGGEMPWHNKCSAPGAQTATAPAGVPTASVTGATIIWHGVYKAQDVEKTTDASAPGGSRSISTNLVPPTVNSDRIALADGIRFGFGYKLIGQPPGATVKVKTVQRFPSPGVFNTATGKRAMSGEIERERDIGGNNQYTGFIVNKAANLPAGTWTFELWYGNRKLAEKSFAVSRP